MGLCFYLFFLDFCIGLYMYNNRCVFVFRSANVAYLCVSVHVQQPLCTFLPSVDCSYPGPFVTYADGPGYEWSTMGTNGLGNNSRIRQLADWTTRGLSDAAKRTKTKHAKSPVASASCPVRELSIVRELTSPRDVQSASRPVRELAYPRVVQ